MKNKNRIVIYALLLVICLVTLASIAAMAVGTAHECVGDTCFVCASVTLCRSICEAHLVTSAVLGTAVLFAVAFKVVRENEMSRKPCSLYSLGVSLLD